MSIAVIVLVVLAVLTGIAGYASNDLLAIYASIMCSFLAAIVLMVHSRRKL